MKYLFIILFIFFLNSCNPESFRLNILNNEKPIHTVIIGNLNGVEQINDNSFIVNKSGKASLRVLGKTQSEMKFELEFMEGDYARFGIRTTRINYDPKKNIIFEINGRDVSLYFNNKLLVNKYLPITDKKTKLIKIFNLGNELKISVDCDEIVNMETKLPVTEYLLVECNNNSRIKLSGIVFDFILPEKKFIF